MKLTADLTDVRFNNGRDLWWCTALNEPFLPNFAQPPAAWEPICPYCQHAFDALDLEHVFIGHVVMSATRAIRIRSS
jgi:hypothetical protein